MQAFRCMLGILLIIGLMLSGCTQSKPAQPPINNGQVFELKTGIYSLEGYNAIDEKIAYTGTVTIDKKGEVYELTWEIEPLQLQMGVGILSGSILSVGYLASSGKDLGVVSYQLLGEDRLDGKWASIAGRSTGREILKRQSP